MMSVTRTTSIGDKWTPCVLLSHRTNLGFTVVEVRHCEHGTAYRRYGSALVDVAIVLTEGAAV